MKALEQLLTDIEHPTSSNLEDQTSRLFDLFAESFGTERDSAVERDYPLRVDTEWPTTKTGRQIDGFSSIARRSRDTSEPPSLEALFFEMKGFERLLKDLERLPSMSLEEQASVLFEHFSESFGIEPNTAVERDYPPKAETEWPTLKAGNHFDVFSSIAAGWGLSGSEASLDAFYFEVLPSMNAVQQIEILTQLVEKSAAPRADLAVRREYPHPKDVEPPLTHPSGMIMGSGRQRTTAPRAPRPGTDPSIEALVEVFTAAATRLGPRDDDFQVRSAQFIEMIEVAPAAQMDLLRSLELTTRLTAPINSIVGPPLDVILLASRLALSLGNNVGELKTELFGTLERHGLLATLEVKTLDKLVDAVTEEVLRRRRS